MSEPSKRDQLDGTEPRSTDLIDVGHESAVSVCRMILGCVGEWKLPITVVGLLAMVAS
jgi:hypothetical protein